MDVMFTTHREDGSGKFYMVVAEAGEWEMVLSDLRIFATEYETYSVTRELIEGLKSWGIEA